MSSSMDVAGVARRFYAVVDEISAGRADPSTFADVADPGLRVHLPGQGTVDRDGFQAVTAAFSEGFPSAVHDIEDVIVDGERAAVRITWRGRHTGEFQGVGPTGRTIEMNETGWLRVTAGKVVEMWPLFDSLTLSSAVGAAATTS